jgi:hypothetical protein
MFGIFKSQPAPNHLSSAKRKLRDLVSIHLKTLALKRQGGITVDAYGTPDGSKWIVETQYFVDKVWSPLLSIDEKSAVLDAGLSTIGQEFIEEPVRVECSRMHASGERDMTIAIYHPPEILSTRSKSASKSSLLSDRTDPNAEIMRGLIIRKEPLGRILSGHKTWEMRSGRTKVRGRIALVQKGSKAVFGIAAIADSIGPLTDAQLLDAVHLHGISPARLLSGEVASYRYAWVLEGVQRLVSPIPYQHKGGVVFVMLDEYAIRALADQACRS